MTLPCAFFSVLLAAMLPLLMLSFLILDLVLLHCCYRPYRCDRSCHCHVSSILSVIISKPEAYTARAALTLAALACIDL